MKSTTDRKRDFALAYEAAVKTRDFAAAADAAEGAAQCAEALAARTQGAVALAYAKEGESWRNVATQLRARAPVPTTARAGAPTAAAATAGGEEWLVAEKPSITFDDVAGMEEAKRVIEEMVIYPLKSPEKARALGLNPGGGVLLYGPPGTGKTMLGKAIAGALEAPFYYASGADLRSKWYGESEKRLAQLLAAAKARPVAVVFLDEIESLLPKRTEESNAADNRVVTQFLSDVGGFEDSPNLLLVLGATNKPWAIDEAVFRTGRFDEKVYVGPPDLAARRKILEINLRHVEVAAEVDLDALAASLDRASGSDVASLVAAAKRAALARAIRDDAAAALTAADFAAARQRVPPSVTDELLRPYREFEASRA